MMHTQSPPNATRVTTSTAYLGNIDVVVSGDSSYPAPFVARCLVEKAELLKRIEKLEADVWRVGSRFNCLVLNAPKLPVLEECHSISEYLRVCENAVDRHMIAVVVNRGKP